MCLRERMESPFSNKAIAGVVRTRGEGDLTGRVAWGTRSGDGTNVGLLWFDDLPLAHSFLGEGVEEQGNVEGVAAVALAPIIFD